MMTDRARLFRRTCELIAQDRKATRRDPTYHLWLVDQIDACARAVARAIRRINRVIDAHTKGGA